MRDISKGRQQAINKLAHIENVRSKLILILKVLGLRNEAQQKLCHQPQKIWQASRISGVSPADISVLMIAMNRR